MNDPKPTPAQIKALLMEREHKFNADDARLALALHRLIRK
jgi:hypothetical protein